MPPTLACMFNSSLTLTIETEKFKGRKDVIKKIKEEEGSEYELGGETCLNVVRNTENKGARTAT